MIEIFNYNSASELVTPIVPFRTVPYHFGTYHIRDSSLKNRIVFRFPILSRALRHQIAYRATFSAKKREPCVFSIGFSHRKSYHHKKSAVIRLFTKSVFILLQYGSHF